jgi:hypothetical protein
MKDAAERATESILFRIQRSDRPTIPSGGSLGRSGVELVPEALARQLVTMSLVSLSYPDFDDNWIVIYITRYSD